jgi:cytochrome c peroxidase
MRTHRVIAGSLVTAACGLAGLVLLSSHALGEGPKSSKKKATKAAQVVTPFHGGPVTSGAVGGPLPPYKPPKDLVPLTDVERLGKDLLYDFTLSYPSGYACASCHSPDTGFTGPSSIVNSNGGPQPGVVPGRFGPRKPQSYGYATLSPEGPVYFPDRGVYIGGNFWDGRAVDSAAQALGPPVNPVEMDNTLDPTGTYPPLMIEKLMHRPYTPLFYKLYGNDVFVKYSGADLFILFGELIAAFEASGEVNQFSSKYDASKYGVPAKKLYTLSASEERGRILYGVGPNPTNNPAFGGGQCFQCHSSATLFAVSQQTQGKDTFTMYCFANIGVPKNRANPFYREYTQVPPGSGYVPNPLGANYVDYGLGGNATVSPEGTKFYNTTPGDIPQFRGLFLTPTNRNVDLRPSPNFVKAYMHNGVFKSLKQVVHFYNKRNIAVNANGHEVAFDLRQGPPTGYTRLFEQPEVLDNVQNVAGFTPAHALAAGTTGVTAMNGQVGNLGLTALQEDDLVAFLAALNDGYTKPNPISP